MEAKRKRIGVYGGTFDPIHNGHLQVAGAIIDAFALDQMLLIPAFVPPHKKGRTITSPFHRYAMLALATAESEVMRLSPLELEAPARPWTIDTLDQLRELQPSAQLFFLMGADSFAEITSWREYERLLSKYHIIVAWRPGFENGDLAGGELAPWLQTHIVDLRGGRLPDETIPEESRTWLTDYLEVNISSSGIREALREGRSVDNDVPRAVARYIEKYQLYQS